MNKEERAAYNREWRKTHPGYSHEWYTAHKEEVIIRCHKRYIAHKEEFAAYSHKHEIIHKEERASQHREWYIANKEKYLIHCREWRRAHPEKEVEYRQVKRARKVGNGGKFTAEEWQALLEKYGHKCLCCGRDSVKLTADHVLPITKGGTSSIGNIQPLCGSCNSKKHTRYQDYRQEYFSDWT